ncbi:biorientation of chromosomes in cell division protein 1-like 1 [Asbolus verrucosus]|uniref:Biorientation of chromosomes in cell division protein 1-like 1 n=1 Tax=Asbolus verrucosus TaxID=1661398 RepID=A0A482VMY3_ASBVE|nr:biorientation of chromosomes in cell division protein 1-like 1 [Asbolus verrucosus]
MEVVANNYLPGDQRLVDKIVYELKSQGIFDQFRKECFADVDTKPAYQNLRQRVEGSVTAFLKEQSWRPDMNKNQVREMLRKTITESGYLETGVERIVDQVVNPKINTIFLPKVEEVVYSHLGIKKPNRNEASKSDQSDLLPTDLEAVSPESEPVDKKDDKSTDTLQDMDESKTEEDESPPFEPLDEQLVYVPPHEENSIDSHLSGFSGLISHESNQSNENKVSQMELDSQMSRNSSDSRLSIVTSDENSKMDLCEDSQSKSIKSVDSNHKPDNNDKGDKSKYKSSDKHKSRSENRSDKERKNSKDSKSRHSSSSKDKDKSHDRKDSKSNSTSSRNDKDKIKDKSDKDRNKSSNSSNNSSKHSSSSSNSKDKNVKKESSRSDKDKSEKVRSSSSNSNHKDSKPRDKSSDSKSKEKSSSSDKHKHSSSSSSSSHGDRHKKDKDRKKDSKSKDDHYSSKEKKNDRRSTDRDSNDGQSSRQNFPSSVTENNHSSQTQKTTQDSSHGTGDSGNSDQVESTTKAPVVITASVENSEVTISSPETQRVKVLKPKCASNIQEALRLMKIRKQLAKLEKENQLSLASVDVSSPILLSSSINLDDLNQKNVEDEKSKQENLNNKIVSELEVVPSPLQNTVISQDNWDAMEAKLREEVCSEFNEFNEESLDDSVENKPQAIQEKVVEEKENEENCKYFDKVDTTEIEFLQFVNAFIKNVERYKSRKETMYKRKVEDSDVKNNNNKKLKIVPDDKKKKLIKKNKEKFNSNADLTPSEKFSLPLSPAESEKSVGRKDETVIVPLRTKRNSINKANNQRYSSDDLYKPRPIFTNSRRRGAKNLEN